MRVLRMGSAIIAAAVLAAACASAEKAGPEAGPPGQPAVIHVANHNFADVNVYAVQLGSRWRLGTVTGLSAGTLRVPSRFLRSGSELRLLLDPVGGRGTFLTAPIQVYPGDALDLNIQATLRLSSLSPW